MKALSNSGKFEADVEDWKNSKENLSNHIQLLSHLSVFKKTPPEIKPKKTTIATKGFTQSS